MKKSQQELYISRVSADIKEALTKMDQSGRGLLFIVDAEERLVGTLTDGDIRRWFLKNGSLPGQIKAVMGTTPKFLRKEEENRAASFMQKMRIRAVPLVDDEKRILDIVFNTNFYEDRPVYRSTALKGCPIVIMAGGKGMRLWPYTRVLPKPLIPIGDIPIVERIMNRFYRFGAGSFYMTVNYRKEMIKAYFAESENPYSVSFVEEEKPLGTAGSLFRLKGLCSDPIIVTNCDVLIDADYEELIRKHQKNGYDITVVTAKKQISIPYGVVHVSEDGLLQQMEEKPKLEFNINTGMYVVEPRILEFLEEEKEYHMTELIADAIKAQKKVGVYQIKEEEFMDMGELSEMNKMEEQVQHEAD